MMSHSTKAAGDEPTPGLDLGAHDTTLSPVLFRDGQDRRSSPRVPISGPVRMGPPSGEPYAVVSASDLSTGGLFIDADRAVKVGARFCLELTLSSGDVVYVPEAEVAYNRERVNGSGFGVRFVDLPVDVAAKLEREVGGQADDVAIKLPPFPSLPPVSQIEILDAKDAEETRPGKKRRAKRSPNLTEPVMNEDSETLTPRPAGDSLLAPPLATTQPDAARAPMIALSKTIDVAALPPEAFDDEGGATEIPARRELHLGASLALDETAYPEPVLASDLSSDLARGRSSDRSVSKSFDEEAVSDAPSRRSLRSMMEGVMRVGQDARQAAVERARQFSPVWTGLAALGLVTVLSAVGLTIWLGSSAQAVEPAPRSPEVGMTATTQRTLMGEKVAPAKAEKKPVEAVKPLSAQVMNPLDDAAAKTEADAPKNPLPPLVVVDESSPEVLKTPELEPAKTDAAKTDAAKAEATAAVAKTGPAKAEAVASAKTEPAKTEPAKVDVAKAEPAKVDVAKVEPTKTEAAVTKAEPAKTEAPGDVKALASKTDVKAARELATRIRAELAEEQPKDVRSKDRAKDKGVSASRVRIGLSSGAKVAKTHVLKAPDRFVIDVTGQKGVIDTPAIGGAIKAVRVGKHPDHTRIVIETKAPIARAKASKTGADLTVAIEYK